jgi:putative ABC transport system permease protein
MRRAIGFGRAEVVGTLAFELFVIVILGIVVGIIDSMITLNFFARNSYKTAPVYPINSILTNIIILFFSSLLAGIIPGYRAARIPPSQALRYTG